MVKKITIFFFLCVSAVVFSQVSTNGEQYNGFASRSFVKFNRFLSIPTFSVLHEDKTTIGALVRNTNIQFEDAPALYMLSVSGVMQENIGVGAGVYQQEVGVFKDLGIVFNFANKIQMGDYNHLTFGINLAYSRRNAIAYKVLTEVVDPTLQNYQAVPVVLLQPALTMSFGNIDAGVHFENLVDYNLKKGEMATGFGDKVYGAHVGYNYLFENAGGLFENAKLRVLGLAKKQPDGFGYGANAIADLPRAGWLKLAYDNTYGIEAGVGVNVTNEIGVGFTYGKSELGATNEIGLIYSFGRSEDRKPRFISRPKRKKTTKKKKSENKTVENKGKQVQSTEQKNDNQQIKDYSKEFRQAQDSINEILRLLRNNKPQILKDAIKTKAQVGGVEQPTQVLPTESEPVEVLTTEDEPVDTSLPRSKETPWREKFEDVGDVGAGGTMYYVAVNQFKDRAKMKDQLAKYTKRGVEAKYVRNPKNKLYYIYINKYAKAKDAEKKRKEVNGGSVKGFENNKKNDIGIKIKSVSKLPVFVERITFGSGGGSYKEPKTQKPAKVYPASYEGVAPGYYLRVSVNGSKAYADKFIDELKADNISAGFFFEKARNLRHVYIYKTNSREEAIRMYKNNLNGTYYDEKRIIQVK